MMVVSKQLQIFFDFLRFCIGSAKEIPDSLKEADWKELYRIAKKQCLVGVLFDGIKKKSSIISLLHPLIHFTYFISNLVPIIFAHVVIHMLQWSFDYLSELF